MTTGKLLKLEHFEKDEKVINILIFLSFTYLMAKYCVGSYAINLLC